jgi:hypothetical protein
MVDETDMSREMAWFYEERARMAINNLAKRNINAQYVKDRQEAKTVILDMIPPGTFVARADSVSLDQIGIVPELLKRNNSRFLYPLEKDANGHFLHDAEQRKKLEREAFGADVFLTGTNTVTIDGKLVNIDGHGNRVAAMIAGPTRVIIVAGVNKLVQNVDEALERIHRLCAPVNAKRHVLKHEESKFGDLPCVKTGKCTDCMHKWRICRYTVIIEGAMSGDKDRLNVVLVGEELGI